MLTNKGWAWYSIVAVLGIGAFILKNSHQEIAAILIGVILIIGFVYEVLERKK